MKELQKAAEILVECGYASDFAIKDGDNVKFRRKDPVGFKWHIVEIFADTLEGRRQANAIEDWLDANKLGMWRDRSSDIIKRRVGGVTKSEHKWRLDRIRWCLEKLSEAKP